MKENDGRKKGGMTGRHHSKETRDQQSKSNKGKNKGKNIGDLNPSRRSEVKAKISAALKGRKKGPTSLEVKARISAALKGTRTGDLNPARRAEVRAKISASRKGQNTGDNNPAKRPGVGAKISASLKGRDAYWMRGRKLSEEQKRKSSESKKGEKNPNWQGKSCTNESRRKISLANSGEKSHFWNGGIFIRVYSRSFNQTLKQQIKERDNSQCQNPNCLFLPKKHYVHHINYDKMNSDPLNLIYLCNSCHAQSNGNRAYWEQFYTTIIKEKYGP